LDGKRKSIEPMAERLSEEACQIQAIRQRLQRSISVARWDESIVFERVARRLDQSMRAQGWCIDDTGFPKWGDHSVGVQRQYSGTLGRVGNCQVMTSLHMASEASSCCIAARLYLPQQWIDDTKRRYAAKIPSELGYESKLTIALRLIDQALSWNISPQTVLADAGYGKSRAFREALEARNLSYIVGVETSIKIWPPDSVPHRPRVRRGSGRPRTRFIGRDGAKSISLRNFAQSRADAGEFRRITYRSASNSSRHGKFWVGRIQTAEGHTKGKAPSEPLWLVIEQRGQDDFRCFLSNLSIDMSRKQLVRRLKLRWRIEQDYREMKDELGLDHFEGRTWQGFHHHVAMCTVAFGFLALKRALFSPKKTPANNTLHGPETQKSPSKRSSCLDSAVPAMSLPC
jgi:SRSO17 transposase